MRRAIVACIRVGLDDLGVGAVGSPGRGDSLSGRATLAFGGGLNVLPDDPALWSRPLDARQVDAQLSREALRERGGLDGGGTTRLSVVVSGGRGLCLGCGGLGGFRGQDLGDRRLLLGGLSGLRLFCLSSFIGGGLGCLGLSLGLRRFRFGLSGLGLFCLSSLIGGRLGRLGLGLGFRRFRFGLCRLRLLGLRPIGLGGLRLAGRTDGCDRGADLGRHSLLDLDRKNAVIFSF